MSTPDADADVLQYMHAIVEPSMSAIRSELPQSEAALRTYVAMRRADAAQARAHACAAGSHEKVELHRAREEAYADVLQAMGVAAGA